MIKDLDKMQKKKTPVRLVINSNDHKVSERVLLKSYTASEEEYAGVFPVTLTVIQYVKAGIKTTDVASVARDGNRVLAAQKRRQILRGKQPCRRPPTEKRTPSRRPLPELTPGRL